MDIDNCIKFVNENPVCYLATVEDDQPRVRAFMCWKADESGFYFDTADYKDSYKQLQANPKCEACFYSKEEHRMLRLSGEVEFLNDPEVRISYFKEKPDNPQTVFFKLSKGNALMWHRDETGKSHKESIEF